MSKRQRSFFDQKPVRRSWPNARKQHQINQGINPQPNDMSAPPFVVSSKTKSKLEVFQFVRGGDSVGGKSDNDVEIVEHDKENIGRVEDRYASTAPQRSPQSSLPSTQKARQHAQREIPPTPIGRVPFTELIRNKDEAAEQGISLSPGEQVYWHHSPHNSDLASLSATPVPRRWTKRVWSSSPNSSSQNEGSNALPGYKSPLDLQKLQRSLKTPQTDPVSDLWNRYSLSTITGRESPDAAARSYAFLNSSSPQTPARTLSNRGSRLRRSFSCKTDWPTSASKRRKIEKSHSQVVIKSTTRFFEKTTSLPSNSVVSRVSMLVEQLYDGLEEPTLGLNGGDQPSCSPILLNGKPISSPRSSNLLQLESGTQSEAEPYMLNENIEARRDGSVLQVKTNIRREDCVPDNESSSEFGDDELDFDIFAQVSANMDADLQQSTGIVDHISTLAPGVDITTEDRQMRNVQQVASKLQQNEEAENIRQISVNQQTSFARDEAQYTMRSHVPNDDEEFDDEFNDDIFDEDCADLLAPDLEKLATVVDRRTAGEANESVYPRTEAVLAKSFEANGDAQKAENNGELSERVACVDDALSGSEDEFGGDDLDFAEIAASTGLGIEWPNQHCSSEKYSSTIQRYLVMEVAEEHYDTGKGYDRPEKILLVQGDKTKVPKAVTLRQTWFDSACTPGSYIHVVGNFDESGQCIIDDANNMLILHPDHLISATVVADSFSCTRRAVLQDRVKATNEANGPQVYGYILHEIFQEAMKANRWDLEWLTKTIEVVATRYLETLFEINVEMTRAIEHLMSKVPELQSWAELFVTARPKPDAIVKDRNGTSALMSVNKLLDVEEHVWSPMYGLKGNIDATVQVTMWDGNDEKTLTVPFEVKTGKNQSNAAHRAQTVLYTLLLSDRYDIQIAYGILYYMESSEISRIPAIRNELRHMIIQRNELACYVRHRLELPPMLKRPHLCGKCYAKTTCFIYHKLIDNGDGKTSGMEEKFDEVVNHLKPLHQEFFKKWDNLLTKEETDVLKFRRELWTMLSVEREKVGRCFGNVVIKPGSAYEVTDAPKINRFSYTFVKQKSPQAFSFTESQITVGEPIVISDERGHFALANGYVTHVHRQHITVAVDRRLHNARVKSKGFDPVKYQSFTGIMEIIEENKEDAIVKSQEAEQVLYRLDKDEFSNGMATVRNNLIKVMEKDIFGAQALRKLVIEGVPPTFRSIGGNGHYPESASQTSLNIDQRRAIEKVMSAKDYALVLGMPGTGKTTTIAHIIRALAAQGKSILLTSYTHTAVDNILLKIRNDGIGILRLGAIAKIHSDVQDFADLASIPKTNMEDLERSYGRQIVATTCLGVNHPIFNQRIFDYCIVDEASQITLPVCLGPIRMAKTFILVGDHYQLPPLVQNKEAQEGGLDISLFKLLSDKYPSSVVNLEHQYRMCEDIMSLSNTLIYDGRLKCGTPTVASRSISIPSMEALSIHHHSSSTLLESQQSICPSLSKGPCWIRSLLDPSVKVSFINTDPLLPLSREIAHGSRITNPVEAALTTQLVESLITVGVKAADIGVITLYRSQLALLKQNLRHRCCTSSKGGVGGGLEMHTADKFQGRDKEVVVLSLVRSNEVANVGDLLKDWRRVNVALTRARTKLLVIGSMETMRRGNELLRQFVELMEGRGWRFDLWPGVLEGHLFLEAAGGGTQMEVGGGVDEEMMKADVESKVEGKAKAKSKWNENRGVQRIPEKRGGLDARALLGKRPVLRDIVNEALG